MKKEEKLELLTKLQLVAVNEALVMLSSTGGFTSKQLEKQIQSQIMFMNAQKEVFKDVKKSKNKTVKKQVVKKKVAKKKTSKKK